MPGKLNTILIMIALTSLSLVALFSTAVTQQLEKPLNAAIDFTERNFDFGFMPKGTRVAHTYGITNKGSDTLRIIKVSAACGCTNAPIEKSDLGPDEASEITVTFDSQKFAGKVTKKVSILSNDPIDPFADIYFSAQVDREHPIVTPKPNVVEVERTDKGQIGGTFKVKLMNKGEEPVGVKVVSASHDFLEARLSREEIPPGNEIDLVIKPRGETNLMNDAWLSVTLETDDPQNYRLTVPLHVSSKQPLGS